MTNADDLLEAHDFNQQDLDEKGVGHEEKKQLNHVLFTEIKIWMNNNIKMLNFPCTGRHTNTDSDPFNKFTIHTTRLCVLHVKLGFCFKSSRWGNDTVLRRNTCC